MAWLKVTFLRVYSTTASGFRDRDVFGVDDVKNIEDHFGGSLGGVDFADESASVMLQQRAAFGLVGFEAFFNHLVTGIVEPVFFKGAFFEAFGEFAKITNGKMKDANDLDHIVHNDGLLDIARDAIENEEIDIGFKSVRTDGILDASCPEFDGDFGGNEQAFAGVFQKPLPQWGACIEGTEDISAGKMKKTGNGAEGASLGAFAAAGSTEYEESFVTHAMRGNK